MTNNSGHEIISAIRKAAADMHNQTGRKPEEIRITSTMLETLRRDVPTPFVTRGRGIWLYGMRVVVDDRASLYTAWKE